MGTTHKCSATLASIAIAAGLAVGVMAGSGIASADDEPAGRDTASTSAASTDSAPGGAEPRRGALTDSPAADLDSLSKNSEAESLRLQMVIDRESKIMSTLSNFLEKDGGDTAENIIDNLK